MGKPETDYRTKGVTATVSKIFAKGTENVIPIIEMNDMQAKTMDVDIVYVKELREILTRDGNSWRNKAGHAVMPVVYKTHLRYFFRDNGICEYINEDAEDKLIGYGVDGVVKTLRNCNIIDVVSDDACTSMTLPLNADSDYEKEDLYAIEIVSGESLTSFFRGNICRIIPLQDFATRLTIIINSKIKLLPENYKQMFNCRGLTIIGLHNVDFSDATTLEGTFGGTSMGDFSNVNITNKCRCFYGAFVDNTFGETLDITGIDTSNGVNFSYMFEGIRAKKIKGVLDTRKATYKNYMFEDVDDLISPNEDERNALMSDEGALWSSEHGIIET